MIDPSLEFYKNDLLMFFDKVFIIDLIEMKLNPNYAMVNKYSKWMKYTVNKWQVLKFTEYDKILFTDVDVLPLKDTFYNIFDINTPAVLSRNVKLTYNKIVSPNLFIKTSDVDDYHDATKIIKDLSSTDASLALFKPDINMYNNYFSFLKKCEGTNGYISLWISGIDETTLMLFFFVYEKINVYGIPYEYAVIPWEKNYYNKDHVKAINFMSMRKPWLKLPIIQWADENVWHIIAKKCLYKSKNLTKIYLESLMAEIKLFYVSIDSYLNNTNAPYI